MLRSRLDQYVVMLGTHSVRLLRKRRGARVEVLDDIPYANSNGLDVQVRTAALAEVLQQHQDVRRISIVMQDDVVAYATVPWTGPALSKSEFDDLSAIRLRELHGARVSGWAVRSWQEYGCHGLACALPANLIEGVERVCASLGVSVATMAPALSTMLVAARIPRAQRDWLAVDVTTGGCLFAAHSDSGWAHVRFVRYTEVAGTDVFALIARECFVMGYDDAHPIVLHDADGVRHANLASLKEVLLNG